MRKWITCTIMAVMMAAMIFMGTGNNVFANDDNRNNDRNRRVKHESDRENVWNSQRA